MLLLNYMYRNLNFIRNCICILSLLLFDVQQQNCGMVKDNEWIEKTGVFRNPFKLAFTLNQCLDKKVNLKDVIFRDRPGTAEGSHDEGSRDRNIRDRESRLENQKIMNISSELTNHIQIHSY